MDVGSDGCIALVVLIGAFLPDSHISEHEPRFERVLLSALLDQENPSIVAVLQMARFRVLYYHDRTPCKQHVVTVPCL